MSWCRATLSALKWWKRSWETKTASPHLTCTCHAWLCRSSSPAGQTNGIEVYDIGADVWINLTNNQERPHARHGTAFLDGYVYCVSGSDREEHFNTVPLMDLSTHTWQKVAPMHFCRSYVCITVLNGCIFTMGGLWWPCTPQDCRVLQARHQPVDSHSIHAWDQEWSQLHNTQQQGGWSETAAGTSNRETHSADWNIANLIFYPFGTRVRGSSDLLVLVIRSQVDSSKPFSSHLEGPLVIWLPHS